MKILNVRTVSTDFEIIKFSVNTTEKYKKKKLSTCRSDIRTY